MGQPAARITDMHVCPMVTGVVPHVGGPIILGSPTVFTGSLPQARVTDMLTCVGPPDVIVKGSTGVFVNSLPAARLGDQTAHGGVIVVGLPTVLIGETGGGSDGGGGGGAGTGSHGQEGDSFSAQFDESVLDPKQAQVVIAAAEFEAQVKVLVDAAKSGTPFCEVCFYRRGTTE